MFFRRMPPKVLGVDISNTSIKVLKLSKLDKRYQIDLLGYESLPPNALQDHEIQNVQEIGELLKQLISKFALQKSQAAIAVSSSAVITKIIEINVGLSEHEQTLHIESVADQYIPFPLNEVSLDYHVLGPSPNQPNKLDVLLVVARLSLIEKYKTVLELAGLTAAYIDVDTYALERAYHTLIHPQHTDQVVAIVDIGSIQTTLNVLAEGRTVYTREQLFGGKQLTEEIQTHYGLTFEEAEKKKCLHDLPTDYEEEILKPFMLAIVQQITRALQFYYSSGKNRDIQKILLAGGSSILPGLIQLISSEMKLPVTMIDPMNNLVTSPQVDQILLENQIPSLSVVCGLALRSFTG